jgi:hypothetical protein
MIFTGRKQGVSKFDSNAQINYIRHLWRLYDYRVPNLFQFIKFSLVGISGRPGKNDIFYISKPVPFLSMNIKRTFQIVIGKEWQEMWRYVRGDK